MLYFCAVLHPLYSSLQVMKAVRRLLFSLLRVWGKEETRREGRKGFALTYQEKLHLHEVELIKAPDTLTCVSLSGLRQRDLIWGEGNPCCWSARPVCDCPMCCLWSEGGSGTAGASPVTGSHVFMRRSGGDTQPKRWHTAQGGQINRAHPFPIQWPNGKCQFRETACKIAVKSQRRPHKWTTIESKLAALFPFSMCDIQKAL